MLRYPNLRPWREFPLAVFDLESTGLDTSKDRIVEIAVLRIHPSGNKDTLELLVNPERPIPPQATAVSGIEDGHVAGAPILRERIWELDRFLRDAVLVGHNALNYDLPLLRCEYERCGLALAQRPVIDTMLWAKGFQLAKKVGLGALCKSLGIPLERAHRAMPDVEATWAVLEIMADRLPSALGELMEQQDQLAEEWQSGRTRPGSAGAGQGGGSGDKGQEGLFR
jgi:DNA polymerase-3 subunit epsilon